MILQKNLVGLRKWPVATPLLKDEMTHFLKNEQFQVVFWKKILSF